MERSGFLQKSNSLIELKTAPSPRGENRSTGPKKGYFGIKLDEVMTLQKERFPDLSLPVILVKLTEEIIKCDGCKTEGIFRVTGSTQQVIKLQQQYNDMNFDETSSDPHVLVGVLKQWLRELKDPLIPTTLYQICSQCETPEDCIEVINQLPQLNKDCFFHLVQLLRKIAQPENQEFTKMDVHNLCLVFAPVMFRCPSTDMAEMMVNLQKEKLFLSHMVESSVL